MDIQERRQGAVVIVKPVGPLSLDDADIVKDRLLSIARSNMGRLVLDASAVPFADSRGLTALVEVGESLSNLGQSLRIAGLNETVREAMELTETADQFDNYADVISAARSFL